MLKDDILPLLELHLAALDGRNEWLQISVEPEDVLRVEFFGHVDVLAVEGENQKDKGKAPNSSPKESDSRVVMDATYISITFTSVCVMNVSNRKVSMCSYGHRIHPCRIP